MSDHTKFTSISVSKCYNSIMEWINSREWEEGCKEYCIQQSLRLLTQHLHLLTYNIGADYDQLNTIAKEIISDPNDVNIVAKGIKYTMWEDDVDSLPLQSIFSTVIASLVSEAICDCHINVILSDGKMLLNIRKHIFSYLLKEFIQDYGMYFRYISSSVTFTILGQEDNIKFDANATFIWLPKICDNKIIEKTLKLNSVVYIAPDGAYSEWLKYFIDNNIHCEQK